jgi:hypothetical protein
MNLNLPQNTSFHYLYTYERSSLYYKSQLANQTPREFLDDSESDTH